jgi:hypothetical protein
MTSWGNRAVLLLMVVALAQLAAADCWCSADVMLVGEGISLAGVADL